MISRRTVDAQIERRILTAMIVSTEFLRSTVHATDPAFFRSSYAQKIVRWVLSYYEKYEEAPKQHIQDIYDAKQKSLREEDAELISELLSSLSESYEQDSNLSFMADEALHFFKKRQLEITINNVRVLVDEEKVDAAQKAMLDYSQVLPAEDETIQPTEESVVQEHFSKPDNQFFVFPGVLGNMIGNLEPGWLVSISAAFKRGKSFFLQEVAVLAAVKHIPVMFYSLEMTKDALLERFYKRLFPSAKDKEDFIYPIFDCEKNQYGTCTRIERRCKNKLILPNGEIPDFSPEIDYRVCTHCRRKSPKDYKQAVWYRTLHRPKYEMTNIHKHLRSFNELYGNKLQMKIYPRFSKSIDDIRQHLDIMAITKNFYPKIIVIDYADILRSTDDSQGFEKEDKVWMQLSALAAERNALVFTATQVTREGQTAELLQSKHSSKWVGKNAHLDVSLSLNQTVEEKRRMCSRIGLLYHRHKEFFEDECVTILQDIELGQFYLDSEYT